MRISSKIILALVSASTLCIFLKMFKLPYINQVLEVSMLSLAFFLLGQMFLGKSLPGGIAYKILQRFACNGMFSATAGILFRFLYWAGWHLEFGVGMVTFVFSLLLLVKWNIIKTKFPEKFDYFRYNYVLPICFLVLTSILSIILPDKVFYETFSTLSKTKSYEQFQAENPGRTGYSFFPVLKRAANPND